MRDGRLGKYDPLQGADVYKRKVTVTHEFTIEEWDLLRLLAMRLKLTPQQAIARWVRGGIEGLKYKNS